MTTALRTKPLCSSVLERVEERAPKAAKLRESVVDLVGNTPLVRVQRLASHLKRVEIYAKLEYFNPGGSVKDRAARQMILDGIADGRLTKDKILIDSSSGNTAVAYAMIGAALGYRVRLVMPGNVTKGRKDITENGVLAAGRAAGLKDVKVVGFSPTHTALKFVIHVARRPAP